MKLLRYGTIRAICDATFSVCRSIIPFSISTRIRSLSEKWGTMRTKGPRKMANVIGRGLGQSTIDIDRSILKWIRRFVWREGDR